MIVINISKILLRLQKTTKQSLQKLLRLQNKAVKFIADGQWNDSPNLFYKELNVLKIEQIGYLSWKFPKLCIAIICLFRATTLNHNSICQ